MFAVAQRPSELITLVLCERLWEISCAPDKE
jgi:hypothetical protein